MLLILTRKAASHAYKIANAKTVLKKPASTMLNVDNSAVLTEGGGTTIDKRANGIGNAPFL